VGTTASRTAVVIVPSALEARARGELGERSDIQIHTLPDETPAPSSREVVETARASYTAMDFDAALSAASQAQLALEARAESRADFAHLADAWLLRGMAELALGDTPGADASFRQAVIILPARELRDADYPPPVRALYADVRRTVLREPPASYTVNVTPPSARLFLDGVNVGTGPTTLRGTRGRHQLRIEAPGRATRRVMLTFEAAGSPPLSVTLPAASRDEAMDQLAKIDEDLPLGDVQSLMMALGADAALWIEPAAGESLAFVAADFEHVERGRAPTMTAALEGALRSFSRSSAGDPSRADANDRAAEPDTEPVHDGFYMRLWAGLALRGDAAKLDAVSADAAVPAGEVEVGAGVGIVPGLIVGGSFFFSVGEGGLSVMCPATATDPACNTATPTSHFVAALKLFANWYPFVSGFHFGGGIGVARLKMDDGFALLPETTAIGVMVDLHVGYDFWITDWSTLGAAIRISGWRGQREDVILSGGAISLLATLAYD
jgi:hypothetical protein